jgi:hypothetical protein
MGRRLRSLFLRVHCVALAVNDIVVDAVLDEWDPVGNTKDALRVGFILREE